MKKIITALILSLSILTLCTAAFAAGSLDFEIKDAALDITYADKSCGGVQLSVYIQDKKTGELVYMNQLTADSKGAVSLSGISLPKSADYTIGIYPQSSSAPVTDTFSYVSQAELNEYWAVITASSDASSVESKWDRAAELFGFSGECMTAWNGNPLFFEKLVASDGRTAPEYSAYSADKAAKLCSEVLNPIAKDTIFEINLLKSFQSLTHIDEVYAIVTSDANAKVLGISGDIASYKSLYSTDYVDNKLFKQSFATVKAFKDVWTPALSYAIANNTKPSSSLPLGGNNSSPSKGGSMGNFSSVAPVPSQGQVSSLPFADLADYGWAQDKIAELYSKGIINGRSAEVFAPADNVTRAEFVTMIVKAFGIEAGTDRAQFDDVAQSDWFYEYVSAGASSGIVKGNGTAFNPNGFITREDMAVIAYRAITHIGTPTSGSKSFTDDTLIADYALDAVSALGADGIISGMPDGSFQPKRSLTRAEAAVVIYNILSKIS